MTGQKFTSINVLVEQHAELKRIAEFKKVRITDLGVEMAEKYISEFRENYGDAMKEMADLEKRMSEIRTKFSEKT